LIPDSFPTIKNSIIWGNSLGEIYCDTTTVTYSCILGGYGDPDTTHNIDCNPQFTDPDAGDYHLQPTSCCIDAGTNNDAPSKDKDGSSRPGDGNGDGVAICDMGAYEYFEHCTYSISPAEANFDSSGGTESIMVSAPDGCSWEAVNNDPDWIIITSESSGSGAGSLHYTVDANPGSEERTGIIYISGKTFQVKQLPNPCNAIRSASGYAPCSSLTIRIDVLPDAQAGIYAVEDTPPEGWHVDPNSINEFGEWDSVNKKVKWGPFFDNTSKILTYNIKAPCDANGCYSVYGTASFDGRNQSICGDIEICEGLSHPADKNSDWQLVISEMTGYGAAWKRGDEWPVEPNPIPISYVTRAGYIWKKGENYHYISGQSAPMWWELVITQPRGKKREIPVTPTFLHSFDPNSYLPGQPISVSVEVIPGQSTVAYALEDAPPEGWQVDPSSINYSGEWDGVNIKVKWGPFFDNQQRLFTYQVTPPPDESGTKDFHAVFSANGTNYYIDRGITKASCIEEICDGKDNNCNGEIDEGLTRTTTCGVGECAGNTGIETCSAGKWIADTCDPLSGATPEQCDCKDNDCDGQSDEDGVCSAASLRGLIVNRATGAPAGNVTDKVMNSNMETTSLYGGNYCIINIPEGADDVLFTKQTEFYKNYLRNIYFKQERQLNINVALSPIDDPLSVASFSGFSSISGYVYDKATGAPIPKAKVTIIVSPTEQLFLTADSSGFYSHPLTKIAAGVYKIKYQKFPSHKTLILYKILFLPESPLVIDVGLEPNL